MHRLCPTYLVYEAFLTLLDSAAPRSTCRVTHTGLEKKCCNRRRNPPTGKVERAIERPSVLKPTDDAILLSSAV